MRLMLAIITSTVIIGLSGLFIYNSQKQKTIERALAIYLADATARVERSLRSPNDERITVAEFISRTESDSNEIDEALIRLKGDQVIDDVSARLLSTYLESSRRFLKSAADVQRNKIPYLLAVEKATKTDKQVSDHSGVADLNALYENYVDAQLLLVESAKNLNMSITIHQKNIEGLKAIIESADFPERSKLDKDALSFPAIPHVKNYEITVDPSVRQAVEGPLRRIVFPMLKCELESKFLWIKTTGMGASNSDVSDKLGKCVAQVLSELKDFVERAVESNAYGPSLPHLLAHGSLIAEWARQHVPRSGEPFKIYEARLEELTRPSFEGVDRIMGNNLPEDN